MSTGRCSRRLDSGIFRQLAVICLLGARSSTTVGCRPLAYSQIQIIGVGETFKSLRPKGQETTSHPTIHPQDRLVQPPPQASG
ncbi:hypothetical protein BDZ97DRAFT_1798218 [Flammula alnicola]|nr:hypothetical protein BDZ97DRAFT_1798218 [Flammula alnicola]